LNANNPVLFRSYQSQETHTCKIWEAARATSAAPTFFKRIEIGNKPFINDDLRCNNPSKLVLEEAQMVFPTQQIGCLVSIGAGQAGVSTDDCEATHEEMSLRFASSPNIYFRINVDQRNAGHKAPWMGASSGQRGRSYYAISQEGGSGQEAYFSNKCYQLEIPKGIAYNGAIWYTVLTIICETIHYIN